MKTPINTPSQTLAKQLHAAIEKAGLLMPFETEKALYRGGSGGKWVQAKADAEWNKTNIGAHSICTFAFPMPNVCELGVLLPISQDGCEYAAPVRYPKERNEWGYVGPNNFGYSSTFDTEADARCHLLILMIEEFTDQVRAHWKTLAENQ